MISDSQAMYPEGQPVVIRANYQCEFTASQFHEMIDRTGIEDTLKEENATNIIVTKLVTPSITESQAGLPLDEKNGKEVPSSHLGINTSNPSASEIKVSAEVSDSQFLNLVVIKEEKLAVNEEGGDEQKKDVKNAHGNTVALCSMCGKNFSSNYNLKRHMNTCKLCPEYEKGPRFQCDCGRSYSQEWDMKKHKVSCQDNRKKCKNCLVPTCNLVFYHRSQLVSHMKKDHNMSIQDPEILEFQSLEDFQAWKEREEERSYTYYSKQTGANVTGVSINTYYVCQHDGSSRTHGASPRKTERRNKKGRVKTGRVCWSQMNVKEFRDGTVRVTYFPSHTHSVTAADTEHHPLPPSISAEIKRRLEDIRSEGEEAFYSEYPELKKSRKKNYGMNVRTLRALARKNRKLFRITAEAVDDTGGCKITEAKETAVDEVDAPEKTVLLVSQEKERRETRREVLENCSSHWSQLSILLESGKLSDNIVAQVESTLASLLGNCQEELLQSEGAAPPAICELSEVMYQNEPLSPDSFPLTEEPQAGIDLKTIDKTVYQVVTFGTKEEPSSPPPEELLYPNAVELVAPREFIIIANDHTQILHTVNPSHIALS